MTDCSTAPADRPRIARLSAADILEEFLASPMGRRFRDCHPADLWDRLRPAIRLAAAIELAGLEDRRAIHVHYVGHGYEDVIDEGRWLQMAKCFLSTSPRLDITMRTAPEVERSRTASRSVLSPFVESLPVARRRTATKPSLFEPLLGKADLVVFSPRPAIWLENYRPFSEVVPSNVPIILVDEVDAATLGMCECLVALGAKVPRIWIDALDDPEAPGQSESPRLAHGALIAHVATHPTSIPPPADWDRYRSMVQWAITDLFRARNARAQFPLWPGAIMSVTRDDGTTYDVINAHPQIPIDAVTGDPLQQPRGRSFKLPADLLARHPGESDAAGRERYRPEDFAWALEASAALDECHDAILHEADDVQLRIDAQLKELGESPPPEMPDDLGGLFPLVQRNDPHAILDRIVLRGASPDQRGAGGITPLILAARLGRVQCVIVLLESHADPSLRDEHGWTALAYAAYAGEMDSVALLLRYQRGMRITLRSGIPDFVFCFALLGAQRDSPNLLGAPIPDPAPMIAAWRDGTLSTDAEPHIPRGEAESPTASAEIRPLPQGPQLQSLPGLLSDPLASISESDSPQARPLSLAVRHALEAHPPVPSYNPASQTIPQTISSVLPVASEHVEPPALVRDYESAAASALRPANEVKEEAPQPSATALAPPRIAGTMAVVATVAGTLGHLRPETSAVETAQTAKAAVMAWLRADKLLPIPDHVDDVFHLDLPNATVLSDAFDGLWTLRYDDQDRAVPGRTWRTEIVIATNTGKAFASLRLVRISPSSDDDAAAGASIPRLVSRLAAAVGVSDAGVPLRPDPWAITSSDGIEALSRLLRNPSRLQPVLVVTSPSSSWIGSERDPGSLVARLHGFVHFVVVDTSMTFSLSRELGRSLGVFGDACRLYRPGFTLDDDAQSNPLFLRRADTPDRSLTSRVIQSAARLAPARVTEEDVPTFGFARALMAQARQHVREPQPTVPAVPADLIHSLEASVAAITDERNTWQQSYSERDAMARSREAELLLDRESLREEINRLRSQNWHLRTQNDQLRTSLARKAGVEETPVSYPDTWDELETWAADVLGDDVVLTSKAIRAARKSFFQNIPLAYRALHLLKEAYLPMRLDRTPERVEAFASRCRDIGVEVSDTGQAVDDRRFKEAYRVSWMGKTYKLDLHLSGSSVRDPTRQLRCYFAYDQDQGCIIIGSLPEHLENSLTRH